MSTLDPHACRLRVRYKKDGRLAHLGHLEVMGTVMRSVRRAGLPFEVSNGFARRMRIQFCQALPVGASSVAEYFDLLMPEPVNADEALDELRRCTPPSLAPLEAALLPRRLPALEAWADRTQWDVLLDGGVDKQQFVDGLEAALARGTLEFMRGDKPRKLDLVSTLVSCDARASEEGLRLVLQTRATERGSLRPAVLVRSVAGCEPSYVCRMGQWHENPDGTLLSPL